MPKKPKKPTIGDCPTCARTRVVLGNHHCHLQDVVRAGLREGLALLGADGPVGRHVVRRSPMWVHDPASVALRRFERVEICQPCNLIDTLLPHDRPPAGFSLSPVEIRRIRREAGDDENGGERFFAALCHARRVAGPDLAKRATVAHAVGHSIALRLFGAGKIDEARRSLAAGGDPDASPKFAAAEAGERLDLAA